MYREGAVATLTVYDRRGKRLGMVSLAHMPEAFQVTQASASECVCDGPLKRDWR